MRKNIAVKFGLVFGIALAIYAAATIFAARVHASAMPSRYQQLEAMPNVHDSHLTTYLFGVFQIEALEGRSHLAVGTVTLPLPGSELAGWAMAVVAALSILVSLYLNRCTIRYPGTVKSCGFTMEDQSSPPRDR